MAKTSLGIPHHCKQEQQGSHIVSENSFYTFGFAGPRFLEVLSGPHPCRRRLSRLPPLPLFSRRATLKGRLCHSTLKCPGMFILHKVKPCSLFAC